MITSTANPKVKRLVTLRKKRRARDEEQVFLAEGLRMFREIPGEMLRELYVSETFYGRERELADRKAGQAGVRPEILSDHVFGYVSDTKTPQGVLCVAGRMPGVSREKLLRPDESGKMPLLMVLDNLQDPGNLGTIVRTGEGAGVTGIFLGRDCVDLYNPKTIRSTMGSIYRMPCLYVDDVPELLGQMKQEKIRTFAAHLEGKRAYDEEDYTDGCAFLMGNEGNGLRREVAELADTWIRIPMEGEVESLNVAIASTVLMFEAGRQRRIRDKSSIES